jgi:hypothetical protein
MVISFSSCPHLQNNALFIFANLKRESHSLLFFLFRDYICTRGPPPNLFFSLQNDNFIPDFAVITQSLNKSDIASEYGTEITSSSFLSQLLRIEDRQCKAQKRETRPLFRIFFSIYNFFTRSS